MSSKINVLAIYASEDKEVVSQLAAFFKQATNASFWYACSINDMEEWKKQTHTYLEKTDVYLLLVSNTFMHSEFVQRIEFKSVIDRYKENKTKVIPILINDCPWNIDFNADDYNFNMQELKVLPEGQKPIYNWNSRDAAYQNITANLLKVVTSFTGEEFQKQTKADEKYMVEDTKVKDQITLDFNQEVQRNRILEEAKLVEEENQKRQEESKRKAAAEIEQRRTEKVASDQKKQEALRVQEEALTKKRATAEKIKKAEAKKRLKQLHQLKEEQKQNKAQSDSIDSGAQQETTTNKKRRIVLAILLSFMTIIGIWMFSRFNESAEEEDIIPSQAEVSEKIDSVTLAKTGVDTLIKEEAYSKLEIGDNHNGGIIFSVDTSGKTGIIAHREDAGPMSWQSAMKIHEQLGEGWRLPTFDELNAMYKTIGNGTSNSGEFANKLYWSATDYDEYQARLIRFSDGNSSYHYNKMAANRQFRVRAVQDFSR